jgi:hypothetical protein
MYIVVVNADRALRAERLPELDFASGAKKLRLTPRVKDWRNIKNVEENNREIDFHFDRRNLQR